MPSCCIIFLAAGETNGTISTPHLFQEQRREREKVRIVLPILFSLSLSLSHSCEELKIECPGLLLDLVQAYNVYTILQHTLCGGCRGGAGPPPGVQGGGAPLQLRKCRRHAPAASVYTILQHTLTKNSVDRTKETELQISVVRLYGMVYIYFHT